MFYLSVRVSLVLLLILLIHEAVDNVPVLRPVNSVLVFGIMLVPLSLNIFMNISRVTFKIQLVLRIV